MDPSRHQAQQPSERPHNWQNCKGELEARPAPSLYKGPSLRHTNIEPSAQDLRGGVPLTGEVKQHKRTDDFAD